MSTSREPLTHHPPEAPHAPPETSPTAAPHHPPLQQSPPNTHPRLSRNPIPFRRPRVLLIHPVEPLRDPHQSTHPPPHHRQQRHHGSHSQSPRHRRIHRRDTGRCFSCRHQGPHRPA